jgi:SAM-dependent methyltransferase
MKHLLRKPLPGESRTPDELYRDYEITKELAERLRHATKEERAHLYSSLYDEQYRRIPYLTREKDPAKRKADVNLQMQLLRPFLGPETVFAEIGPGDCAVSFAAAKRVRQVVAVDVSAEVTRQNLDQPTNFRLIISDGSSIPVPPESVNVVYSNQMMEHLHPDDAVDQLRNIYAAIKPGGTYLCVTPNRLNGPHDIARYFDHTTTCLHLKEYTFGELLALFREAGFTKPTAYIGGRGRYFAFPVIPIIWLEKILTVLPEQVLIALGENPLGTGILGIRLAGSKPVRKAAA